MLTIGIVGLGRKEKLQLEQKLLGFRIIFYDPFVNNKNLK